MKFKSKHMEKLDNPMRRKMLPVEKVLELIQISEKQHIADIGCGIGYFTLPMAKAVGEEGKVYAVDINKEMLEEIKRRVEEQKLLNVEIIQSLENDFKINDNTLDVVFTSTVFHEVNSPVDFLQECKRVLKSEGVIIILDWNKVTEEFGPPEHKRLAAEKVNEYAGQVNLTIVKEDYIGKSFYVITLKE